MRIAKQQTNVKIEGGIKPISFGIIFDSAMVNILSNQLYEDKVLAIVRELSTNALDSQTEAGYTGKFEVHLPNWDDMSFWIRDYGTGMSPDKVNNIYRNYGASDRSESNDFTGCMGLGSKTPFCYHTKTFTVDSWYNGVHYQYACFLNEDGMPQIAKMTEELSDEHSGVKVSLPVKKTDVYDFETAAKNVYRFFGDNVPKISGRSVDVEKPKYTLENGNWKFDENESLGMRIVMGNVSYRVNEEALGQLNTAQRQVVNNGFHVYVPIGEVGVTASREGLDYTNRTKTHIRGYINKIIESFNEKAQKDISQCKNLWEARLRFIDYERDNLRGIFDSTKITYNGKTLFDTQDNLIDFDQMVKDEKVEVYHYAYSTWRNPERSRIRGIRVHSRKPRLYDNDVKIGGFVRSEAECKKHSTNVVLIKFAEDHQDMSKDEIKQEFCDIVGLAPADLTLISSIPSPTKHGGGQKRGNTSKVVEYVRRSYGSSKSIYWKNINVNMDDGGIYVEFYRFNVRLNGDKTHGKHPNSLDKYIKHLEEIGITVPPIYGVKSAHIHNFDKNSKWENFYDWALNQVRAKANGKPLFALKKYKHELDRLGSGGYHSRNKWELSYIHRLASYCNERTQLHQFSKKVKEVEDLAKDWNNVVDIIKACNLFGIEIEKDQTNYIDLYGMEELVYAHYPLLKLINTNYSSRIPYEHVALYINSVDGN